MIDDWIRMIDCKLHSSACQCPVVSQLFSNVMHSMYLYIYMYIYSFCLKICDCSTYLEQFNLYVCIRDLVRMHVTVSRAILHVICDVSAIFPRLLARVCQQCACHSHLAYHFLLSFLVSFVEFDRWLHYHEHFRMWSSFHPIPTTTPQKKKKGSTNAWYLSHDLLCCSAYNSKFIEQYNF